MRLQSFLTLRKKNVQISPLTIRESLYNRNQFLRVVSSSLFKSILATMVSDIRALATYILYLKVNVEKSYPCLYSLGWFTLILDLQVSEVDSIAVQSLGGTESISSPIKLTPVLGVGPDLSNE